MVVDDAARLAKNDRIRETGKATRARRKAMTVRVRELKIATRKLNRAQREALIRLFLEAKWLRNSIVGAEDFSLDYIKSLNEQVDVKTPEGFETRELTVVKGQLAQAVLVEIKNNLRALSALKKKGKKVGRLKFVSEVNSVNYVQFGVTHKFNRDRNRIKLANIPGWLRVNGLEQLDLVDEIANAKLIKRAAGYYLMVTTYTYSRPGVGRVNQNFVPGTAVGIDMGVKTHLTLSDGTKIDAMFGETDRQRRLRRKLARQKEGSANYRKTLSLVNQEGEKVVRRRNDAANKIVHEILKNETVYFQDENISAWKRRKGYVRGGRRIHASVLGRVKARLKDHSRTVMLGRFVATTARCICGVKTPHHVEKRTFVCSASNCTHIEDRDIHAAKNMIRLGRALNGLSVGRTQTLEEADVSQLATPMDFSIEAVSCSLPLRQEAALSSATP